VLASLLPGLRELRTPLTVGWTWLAALWVAFGTFIPEREKATGLLLGIYEVGDGLGKAIILGVLAFIAYLLGSLVEWEAGDWVFRPRGRYSGRASVVAAERLLDRYIYFQKQEIDLQHKTLDSFAILNQVVGSATDPTSVPENSRESTPDLTARVARIVLRQQTQLESRLLAEKREVYDYYDRLKESADLRVNLAFAVAILGTATAIRLYLDRQAAWTWALAILAGLVVAIALFLRGRYQYGRSRLALATAVVTGIIKSPILDEWETIVRVNSRRLQASQEGTVRDGPDELRDSGGRLR
jgi:hypothetical protein